MGVVEVLDPVRPTKAGGWKVDVSRGERNGRVSSEWFNRPDDERYLLLDDLWGSVKGRSERSRSRVVQTADIRVEATRDNPEHLHLMLPKAQEPVAPTHWAFGQLVSIVGAPASYLRQLPAPLAGINLMVWTAPTNGIAMCHFGDVAINRTGEPSTCRLQHSGSISPSPSFRFMGLVLTARYCSERSCVVRLF
jgi:hypothetical protein